MRYKFLIIIFIILVVITGVTGELPWQHGFWGRGGFTILGEDALMPLNMYVDSLLSRLLEISRQYGSTNQDMFLDIERRVKFIHYISIEVDKWANTYYQNLIPLILTDPLIENVVVITILNTFISLLQPLYGAAILLTAIYLIFMSISPKERAILKSALIKMIIGIGIITLTLPIIQLLLQTSHWLSSFTLDIFNPDPNMFKPGIGFLMGHFVISTFFEPVTGAPFLTLAVILPLGVLMILAVRYLMVILLTIFFPFTILLYSFRLTNNIGRRLLFQTFLWIFLPFIDSIILGIIWLSVITSPVQDLYVFIILAGFILLIFVPLITLGILNFIVAFGIIPIIVAKPIAMITAYLEESEESSEKGQ